MSVDVWNMTRQEAQRLGQRLRDLRGDMRLEDMALVVSCDAPTLSRIERGQAIPPAHIGERITAWIIAQDRLQSPESDATPPPAVSMHPDPHTLIRSEDSDTSYRAACAANRANATAVHQWIDGQLTVAMDGLTHEELWARFWGRGDRSLRSSQSGLRTRVSELVRGGVVRDSGRRRTLSTGRKGIVWTLVDES